MSLQAHQIQAAQVAASLATAARDIRANTNEIEKVDAALVTSLAPLMTQLDAAVNALGKYAWAPAPIPPVSAAAGGA